MTSLQAAELNEARDQEQLTPAAIAEQVEEAMQRFASVDYSAEFLEVRDANALRQAEPLLVGGSGRYTYRSDGRRWLLDEHGFRISGDPPETEPRHLRAGFDGTVHYWADERRMMLGEEDLGKSRLEPRAVFWRAARDWRWLTGALRRDGARIQRQEIIDGHPCVVVVSQWRTGDHQWRYEITFSPKQSWLPIRTAIQLDGQPYADETTEKLAQTDDGVWYPATINWVQHQQTFLGKRKQIRITSFKLRNDFRDDEFRFEPPIGYDVMDYRRGVAWHNDPWWPELEPWLRQQLNWPRPDLLALHQLQSYADPGIQGQPAPEIQAVEWLNGDPGPWDREGRRITVLFFFGGRAISPTPRWLAAIKTLQERYRDAGVDVIGVATHSPDPERTKQTIEELGVTFPVALDQTSDSGPGETANLFGLGTSLGVFVIDPDGRVQMIQPDGVPAGVDISALEYQVRRMHPANEDRDERDIDPAVVDTAEQRDERLTIVEYREIKAEWQRLRDSTDGNGTLRITLTFPGEAPPDDGRHARIRIVPLLHLLSSNVPGSRTVFSDDRAEFEVASDADFEISGLRKGTYQFTVSRPGFARVERQVTLFADDDRQAIELPLTPGDRISGTVVDMAGEPIAGARVRTTKRHLDPARPEGYTTSQLPRQVETTDREGQFAFIELYEGSYELVVTADGYQPATVALVPAGDLDVSVVLHRSAAPNE